MRNLSVKLITALLGVTLLSGLMVPVFAQEDTEPQPGTGQALEISPPVLTLSGDPGDTIQTQIRLRNVSAQDLIVTGQVNDFEASGETGAPRILLDEEQEDDNPYSLRGWLTELPEILIVPNEVRQFPITINIPEDASPGGHFGTFRFSAVAPSIDDSGVSLATSLGTLIFVTVSGDTNENLELVEFSVNQDGETPVVFESVPVDFVTRVQNKGNVHVEPRGQIQISDMFGNQIAAVNVNLPGRKVLPESTRRFEQALDGSVIGGKWLFGRYTAQLDLEYGQSEQQIQDSLTFWVIPYRLIGVVVVVLVIGFFMLRGTIRRYNEYIINKSRK